MRRPTYEELEKRIADASDFLATAAGVKDDRAWCHRNIDAAVRVLQGSEYDHFVAAAKAGDDGPDTYEWYAGDRHISFE